MLCAYMRPRYQVSVYRTIGPLVLSSNRNRSALVLELLSNKSLRARDLIFFTTDLQTVNYYTTIYC